jgi:hypothetical protein
MRYSLVRMVLISILLQISCAAAYAVTWFDSNIRPDGACDSNTTVAANASVNIVPVDDGTQVVSAGNQEGDAPMLGSGDAGDSSGE